MHCFNFDTRPITNIEYLLQPPTPITNPLQNTLSCPYRLFFLPATQTPSSPESQSSLLIRPRISPKNMRDSLPQATDHTPDHPPQATGHRPSSSYPSTHPAHGPASQPTGRYIETTSKIRTSFPSTTDPDPQTTLPDDGPEPQNRRHGTKAHPRFCTRSGSSLPLLARIPSPGRPADPWGQSSGHT